MSKLHRNRAQNANYAGSISDFIDYYRQLKKEQVEWNKKHYSGLRFSRGKHPWYLLTTGKQYNYEERTVSWGQFVNYFRVKSQVCIHVDKTSIHKMTRRRYNDLLIEAKMKDWLKKNPKPIEYNPLQPDLFEKEFMLPWVLEHTKARENITKFVNNIGNKVFVYARYRGDIGYPRKVMEFRSDHQKLMIFDGKYANHLNSKSIQKAQFKANRLALDNPNFIALKVVDGNQECILIPHVRIKAVA